MSTRRLNTSEFIIRSNKIHNNYYDYSLVKYINNKTKVKIICKEHGIFEQLPMSHLRGSKCLKCTNKSNTKTTKQFILESKKIHGEKYDYSLIDYKNAYTKVKIICKEHGVFNQQPNNHLNGQGCPICSGVSRKTTEQFIIDSKKVHGEKYDYSLVNYINAYTKVKIICKEHGVFKQMPISHINNNGCAKCAGKNKTTKEFIDESNKVHNNKYDYSLTKYINSKSNVKIICKKHGIFEQTPSNHLNGNGCVKCINDKISLNNNIFIDRSNIVHNFKYDYSLVDYINNRVKIKIICPFHGIFEQQPLHHLNGSGCPICKTSKGEKLIKKLLDSVNIKYYYQKRFENCKNNKPLPFDFYLPDYNICIEYDGIQHFKPISIFGGKKSLENQKIKDKIKNEYCEKNNIKLIRIKYTDNINYILNNLYENICIIKN
mgnify:CR=1 FL=1